MNRKIELSIITVNYNGIEDTLEMIESLKKHLVLSYEIIVVDNASRVNEADIVAQRYPDVVAIRSEKNLGFSGGNNLGIKVARGKYIMMLNNDTYVLDDSIGKLTDLLNNNLEVAAVSPKIKYADSPDYIQYAGATPFSAITLRNKTIGFGEIDKNQYNMPCRTSFLHGAAMVIRKEVIDKVGLMPEIFFLYYEEIDWSSHFEREGYSMWYVPQCTIFHKESRSVGTESELKVFYMTRNRLLYAWRNRRGLTRFLCLMYLLSIVSLKNSLKYIAKGRFDLFLTIFRGNIAFFVLKNKNA